ncbi:DNA replication endonuclease-helicase Dna2 [Marasmius tenuissimus]|nr:DNA replication endonuclease-helicase Dna2 [Marasmius tenuissimus]
MSRLHPSEQEEVDFMKDLLAGLGPDDSFWNATLTPDSSPVKKMTSPRTPIRSAKHTCIKSPIKPPKPPPTASRLEDTEAEELMNGVEDWDWDMSYELSPKKLSPKKNKASPMKPQPPKAKSYIRETCTRCVVETVGETEVNGKLSKQLVVKVSPTEELRSVILNDDWASTDVREGDTINVLGEFIPLTESSSLMTSSIVISSKKNNLILHPDVLVTATALSTAAHCRRKALLSGLIRSSTDMTPSLVWGNMLHTVFQTCLAARRWDDRWIDQQIDEVVRSNLADLVRIEMNVEMGRSQVKARAKGIQTFFERYLSDDPKSEAVISNTRASHGQTTLLAITDLLDVEEDIWSPTYGLKGKIDATLQTTISEKTFLSPKPTLTHGPKPLEIKTGRSVGMLEHRAQTMLYTLLAQERYGMEVSSGLLFYTQHEDVVQVPQSQIELRHLILARNEIAAYTRRRQIGLKVDSELPPEPFLPPTIDDERTCKRCYSIDSCMLYRKAVENIEDTSSPIADAYELKTGHLTSSQTAFFKKWEHLLSLEEHDIHKFRKELWTMGAAEREAKGRCLSSMALDTSFKPSPLPTTAAARDAKIHAFTYRFKRAPSSLLSTSLLNGLLDVNDAVTISVEPNLIALAHGFILALTPTEVVVGVDHDLSLEHIRSRPNISSSSEPIIYRIDRDDLHGGMARIRDNLAQIFYADGDSKRLELVVDLRKPYFHDPSTFPMPPAVAKFTAHLNPHQCEAVKKVLTAQDYALVLGMPGTGKTTVIAAIIKIMVEMGKTVLLTSYTHSAVDTILMKLKDDVDFTILRMGNVDKVHPDVRHLTLSARIPATTVEQLEHQLMTPPVVATTCLSIDQGLFSRRKFDYCIVDEASQITLPTCLGPLRFADKFVLVGDHFQLPPLVRNPLARKGGLDVSLFRRLSDAHPGSVVDLAYQYRMNADIMLLSNKLIYGNRLRCGSEEVARQALVLPDRSFLQNIHNGTLGCSGGESCWIERLMDERCKAVFVDTDMIPCHDSRVGDLVQNEGEANIVYQVTETLICCGIQPSQLGIISLYRQQIKVLSQKLKVRSGIEFMTADKSQGRDKDCIIISLVRSNSTGSIGDLVRDWRRMNVSFTRARSKLIIVGSRKTLADIELLHEFFVLMEGKGWILQLPAGADTAHSETFVPVVPASPRVKRHAGDHDAVTKENPTVEPPQKKQKKVEVEGLLRGRPILQDLVNDTK